MNVRVVERSGAGRCGYCRDLLLDEQRSSCPSCAVAYHRDCAAELGRCGTRGCVGAVVAVLRPVDLLVQARRRERLARLLPVVVLLGLLVSAVSAALVYRWRLAVSAREAAEAAAAQELGNKLGELSNYAQYDTTGVRLQRARAIYKELSARGQVTREFVEEQVRRGHGYTPYYELRRPSEAELVDAITRPD